jgi:hypothetical protein
MEEEEARLDARGKALALQVLNLLALLVAVICEYAYTRRLVLVY